jgi:tetratricopeptide (TPR) repeat protein
VALILACCSTSSAAPVPVITQEQIDRWVRELGDENFEVREKASEELWKVGERAEKAVEKALTSTDAEVRRRAQELLDKFQWGIYPNTPKELVDLVQQYKSGPGANQTEIIRKLLEAGGPGWKIVMKMARRESNPQMKRFLIERINDEFHGGLPNLLVDKNFELIETLLDLALESDVRSSLGNYSAYWLLRGQLEQRITFFKEREEKTRGQPEETALILAHLYRAREDYKSAEEAALRAKDPLLAERILYEAGDWKKLSAQQAIAESSREVERLGLKAAYARLAGDKKAYDQAIQDLMKLHADVKADPGESFQVAKALFINDSVDLAMKVLAESGHHTVRFRILLAQYRHEEALALVDEIKKTDPRNFESVEILLARTLYTMGEKEKALAIFKRYGEQIKPEIEVSWYEDLIEAEYEIGLQDQAIEHAALVLKVSQDEGWAARLFDTLFPGKDATAVVWWKVLRTHNPGKDFPVLLGQLRKLLDGKATEEEVKSLVEAGTATAVELNKTNPVEADGWLVALAEVAVLHKLNPLAVATLQKAQTSAGLIRLGDLHAEAKQWEPAIESYGKAWEKNRREPLALYLKGWALVKAGKDEQGKQLMEQAHWLPLGNELTRYNFSRELIKRGWSDEGMRESELVIRVGTPGSYYVGESFRRRASQAVQKKDFLMAAENHEKAMLRVLRGSVAFINDSAYVGVPAMIHSQRAAGLVSAGKMKEAMEEVALSQSALPGNVDLPIRLVPMLEEKGHKKEADEVFNKALAAQEQACKTFPSSSNAHNSYAWLCAVCKRNLDKALEHSLQATKLVPDHAGHLDTLAEVYFQLGQQQKAIETQTRVVELDPERPYFRKQLERIKAGDRNAELPPDEE